MLTDVPVVDSSAIHEAIHFVIRLWKAPATNLFSSPSPVEGSCLRAKEFFSKKGIHFTALDVLNDPTAQERLVKLGARTVPVLANGDQYIFCQNLEDVAEFAGLQGSGTACFRPLS